MAPISLACTSMWGLWKLCHPVKQWLNDFYEATDHLQQFRADKFSTFSRAKPLRSPRLVKLNSFSFDRKLCNTSKGFCALFVDRICSKNDSFLSVFSKAGFLSLYMVIPLYTWCLNNRLTPHPVKCETLLVSKSSFVGPIAPVRIGNSFVNQVNKSRLLGTVVDNKLSWTPHLMDLKKCFAIKLALLERCKFLPKNVLEALYLTVILPTVTYGLPLWGCCSNKELFNSVEKLHSTAAKIIFNLRSDTPHTEALKIANWHPLCYKYKIALVKLMHKAHWENLPLPLCDNIICRRTSTYPSRTPDSVCVPRFNSRFVHFSIRYRGAAIWNNTLA